MDSLTGSNPMFAAGGGESYQVVTVGQKGRAITTTTLSGSMGLMFLLRVSDESTPLRRRDHGFGRRRRSDACATVEGAVLFSGAVEQTHSTNRLHATTTAKSRQEPPRRCKGLNAKPGFSADQVAVRGLLAHPSHFP
jgi:hypothetical protein